MTSSSFLSLISGHMKFSTVKMPEVLWIQSVSIQMDILRSQILHCFLCSKNSSISFKHIKSGRIKDKMSLIQQEWCQIGHHDTSALKKLVLGHWPAGTSPGAPAAAGLSFGLGRTIFQPNWTTPHL